VGAFCSHNFQTILSNGRPVSDKIERRIKSAVHRNSGEQPMKMTKFCKHAVRAVALMSLSAVLHAVPMLGQASGQAVSVQQQLAQLNAVANVIGMTPDQVTQLQEINADMVQKMAAVRNSGEDPSTARPKVTALRVAQQTQIRAMLTDDQKTKYDAYLAAQSQGRHGAAAPAQ
jgi:hypothetical protein